MGDQPIIYATPPYMNAPAYPGISVGTEIPPAAPTYYQTGVPPAKGVPVNYEDLPAKAHWTGSSGFVIGLVALILVIVVIIILLFFNHCSTPAGSTVWGMVFSSSASATFVANGNTIFYNSNTGTSTSLKVQAPTNALGQQFIIDNIAGTGGAITATFFSNNGTTQLTPTQTIASGTAAQFVWTAGDGSQYHTYWTS